MNPGDLRKPPGARKTHGSPVKKEPLALLKQKETTHEYGNEQRRHAEQEICHES